MFEGRILLEERVDNSYRIQGTGISPTIDPNDTVISCSFYWRILLLALSHCNSSSKQSVRDRTLIANCVMCSRCSRLSVRHDGISGL